MLVEFHFPSFIVGYIIFCFFINIAFIPPSKTHICLSQPERVHFNYLGMIVLTTSPQVRSGSLLDCWNPPASPRTGDGPSVQQLSFLGVAQYLHSSFGRLCWDVTVQERNSLAVLLTASFMCCNMFGSHGKQTSHSLPWNTTRWSSKRHVSPISGHVQFNKSHASPRDCHSQKGCLV